MEPISTALAGIALVKSAVDGIKSAIGTANDIGDIASQIDALFAGQKQVNEARNKKSGVGLTDQFGVDSVAREVIDARIAAEKLQEVATMVDMRFGPGTWKGILEERQKRIQEAKEAAMKARREAILRQEEIMENVKMALLLIFVIVVGIGAFILLMVSAASSMSVRYGY
jgi:hypothetical protein|tara:strand:+ start:686 stop:1195 length:510 start_codon:yes stop_codon:yes gene_type:complete